MQGQYNLRNPAVKRLMKEAQELKEPTEQYYAQPLEDNIFEWHFTIRGPADSEFEGGVYHGRIVLPPEYPMKPPSIILLTQNGRFELNAKICLSISGHHPESWRPSWSIRTAILAIIGFMPTHGNGAIGSLDYTPEERKTLARRSQEFKCQQCGSIKHLLKPVTDASKETQKEAQELASQISFQAEKKKGKSESTEKTDTSTPASPPTSTTVFQTNAAAFPPSSMIPPPGMPPFPPGMQFPAGMIPPFPPMPFPYPYGQVPQIGVNPGQVPTSTQGQFPPWPPGAPFNPFMMPFMPPTPGMPNPFMFPGGGVPNPFMFPSNPSSSSAPSSAASPTTVTSSTPAVSSPSSVTSTAQSTATGQTVTTTSGSIPSSASVSSPPQPDSNTHDGPRRRNVRQEPETVVNRNPQMQYAELLQEQPQEPLFDRFSVTIFILCSIGMALLTMRRLGLFDSISNLWDLPDL